MNDEQTATRRKPAPPSPLDPYRSIIEQNPVEDHFTNKRLRKHMRHVGLTEHSSANENKQATSLAQDEHRIHNSETQKYKRFRQKFIFDMVDSIEEVDRARQVEFRNQLELWDKMYSNRIQRIQAYDKKLERKYGLFVDKEMKKQLIRENLPKMPVVPSVTIPPILPGFIPQRPVRRAASSKTTHTRSKDTDLAARLTKLENSFSKFEQEDFFGCYTEVNVLKTKIELLQNDKNAAQDEVLLLQREIEELKTDLNDIVRDQDMLKINQLKHKQNIYQLRQSIIILQNHGQPIRESSSLSGMDTTTNDEHLNDIRDKQKQFDASLQTIMKNIEELQTSIITSDDVMNQLTDTIVVKQQSQIQKIVHKHLNVFKQKIVTSNEEFKEDIQKTMKQIQEETIALEGRLADLEGATKGAHAPQTINPHTLRFVEKLAPMDLLELDWHKYQ